MPSEVILYSHYGIVDRDLCSSFALLYDRVILPLADFSAGENPIARDLRKGCPVVQDIVKKAEPLKKGRNPLCRNLTEADTSIAGCSEGCFKREFDSYLAKQKIDWKALCAASSDLDKPFSRLQAFITAALMQSDPTKKRKIAFYTRSGPSQGLLEKISAALEVQ